jgi:hypothetical protein
MNQIYRISLKLKRNKIRNDNTNILIKFIGY